MEDKTTTSRIDKDIEDLKAAVARARTNSDNIGLALEQASQMGRELDSESGEIDKLLKTESKQAEKEVGDIAKKLVD